MHRQSRNHLGNPAVLVLRAVLAVGVLTALLAIAPAAQASKAVIGTIGTPNGEGNGRLFEPQGIAVNRSGAGGVIPGDVYVVDSGNSRVSEFSASGAFVRSFGYDVVASGPGDTGANERQTLSVDATGGTFAIEVKKKSRGEFTAGSNVVSNVFSSLDSFHVGDVVTGGGVPGGTTIAAIGAETLTLSANATSSTEGPGEFSVRETSAPISFNASEAQLQAALEALPAIGPGNVVVSGAGPFTIEYKGALAHDDVFHTGEVFYPVSAMTPLSEGLSGASHTTSLKLTTPGGGYEVCEAGAGDVCKAAPNCNTGGGTPEHCEETSGAGSLNNPGGVAVDQATGNLYVTDGNVNRGISNNRVNAYSAGGAFEGSFGWSVNASDPKEELQFCTTATGCQKGSRGGGAGQLGRAEPLGAGSSGNPAIDPSDGHVYVPDGANSRVAEFALVLNPAKEVTGASFVKAFGYDVVQSGPDNVTPVNEVQLLTIPSSVTSGKFTLSFDGSESTPELNFNVTSKSTLSSALNGLSTVKAFALSGSTVIEPILKDTGKWELVFKGLLENEPVPKIEVDSSKLVGGEATVTTLSEGVNVYERCDIAANPSDVCKAGLADGGHLGEFDQENPISLAVDTSGGIYALDQLVGTCAKAVFDGGVSGRSLQPRCRVLKFNSAATAAEEFAPALLSGASGASGSAVSPTDVAVDPTNDHVLVAKKQGDKGVKFLELDSSGTLVDESPGGKAVLKTTGGNSGLAIGTAGRFYFANPLGMVDVFGPPPAPSASIGAVTNVGATSAAFHGTVTPPPVGPEGEAFDTTYHFEYSTDGESWSRFPADDVDVGNGSGAGSPGNCPTNNPPTCEVQQTATGLEPNAEYEVRLVATTGTATTTGTVSFQTQPGAPSISGMLAEEIEETSAKLTGFINPNNQPTTYHFEWGTDTGYGNRIPAEAEEDAGSGGQAIKVNADISGLKATTTYHFRLVAESATGTTEGPDQAFSTLDAAGLPDGRGYELVSPADKRPQGTVSSQLASQLTFQSATDGNSFLLPIYNGLLESTTGGSVSYLARREAGGWASTQMSPPSLQPRPNPIVSSPAQIEYFSPDLSCGFLETADPLTADVPAADIKNGVYNLFRRNADGSFTLITKPVPDNPGVVIDSGGELYFSAFQLGGFALAGASPDCGRVYFKTRYHLLPGASALYEWDHGTLRDAGVLPDGSAPAGLVGMGSRPDGTRANSVSRDGSRVFFNAISDEGADAGRRAVFVRSDGGAEVIDASHPQTANPSLGANYEIASADGSHVFFRSNYGLAAQSSSGPSESCAANPGGAPSTACDLYDYDVDTGQLTDISADSNPADPRGAVALGILDVSDDGSYVYFAARGQLIPGKGNSYAENSEGAANLYLYHEGTLSYVATLGTGDLVDAPRFSNLVHVENNWTAQATPDGRYLLFTARANVNGYDSGGAYELYRHAADTGETVCVSCRRDGLPSVADSRHLPIPVEGRSEMHDARTISDDGRRIFFVMPDVLAPGAVSGNENVYEWEGGQVYLLATLQPTSNEKMLESSPSGDDVFILGSEQLAPQDADFAPDVYDVRASHSPGERIGFPASEPAAPCDPLDGKCRPAAGPQPTSGADPASSGFSGPGNAAKPGKKHRHKPKKHHRKKRHRSGRAGGGQGGGK